MYFLFLFLQFVVAPLAGLQLASRLTEKGIDFGNPLTAVCKAAMLLFFPSVIVLLPLMGGQSKPDPLWIGVGLAIVIAIGVIGFRFLYGIRWRDAALGFHCCAALSFLFGLLHWAVERFAYPSGRWL